MHLLFRFCAAGLALSFSAAASAQLMKPVGDTVVVQPAAASGCPQWVTDPASGFTTLDQRATLRQRKLPALVAWLHDFDQRLKGGKVQMNPVLRAQLLAKQHELNALKAEAECDARNRDALVPDLQKLAGAKQPGSGTLSATDLQRLVTKQNQALDQLAAMLQKMQEITGQAVAKTK